MIGVDDLKVRFTYHAPQGTAPDRFVAIREKALEFATIIDILCPMGREKALAVTKLEEVVMWANAAIARNPEGER